MLEIDPSGLSKVRIEDQFILRLPQDVADNVRFLLHTKPKKLAKKLKITLDPEIGQGIVEFSGKHLQCYLRKFPTIIESLKTYNRSHFVKTADICHMLDCVSGNKEIVQMPHGLTPPLKNVKKRRFRKCLINRDEEATVVQKEVYFLLQTDLEAVSSKFEIIAGTEPGHHQKKRQIDLFGEVLTDSEGTDSNIEEV